MAPFLSHCVGVYISVCNLHTFRNWHKKHRGTEKAATAFMQQDDVEQVWRCPLFQKCTITKKIFGGESMYLHHIHVYSIIITFIIQTL